MPLAQEDRAAVTELISLHGHLVDAGRLDRLDELFTADVRYDLSDFGQGTRRGCPPSARPRVRWASGIRWPTT